MFESPSFIAGYVRSYARYLELDPEWAFAKFCEESDYTTAHGMSSQASSIATVKAERTARMAKPNRDLIGDPKVAFSPKGDSVLSRVEPRAIGSMLVLLGLIGGLGYGGWSVLQEVQRVQFAPVEQAPGVAINVDPLAVSTDTTVMAAVEQDSGFTSPNPDALDRLYQPQALEVPVMVARDGPIASLNPDSFGTLAAENELSGPDLRRVMAGLPDPVERANGSVLANATTTDPHDPSLIRVTQAGVPEVAIFAVNEAWVRVRSASGTVIFEKVMAPGEKYILPKTEDPATLRTGYAGTVYFAVNGETYGPAGAGASVVSKVALSEGDIKAKYALADLGQGDALAKVVAQLSIDPALPVSGE